MVTKHLKQRFVGILVLLALAVIFIPVIFDFQPSNPVDKASQIPPAPDIEPVVIQPPVEPEVDRDNLVQPHDQIFDLEHSPETEPVQSEVAAVPEESQPLVAAENVPPKPEPKLADTGLPEAWVIQVVSYQESFKAEALSQKLLAAGHRAFVRPATVKGTRYYRVYVGPHVLRRNADQEKQRIDSSFGVKSLVIPFEP
jgi:DedD protein